jgi:predicted nuclease of predicted toxin-antitoxin system
MKFLLDEHFSPGIADQLRRRGIDAVCATERGLLHFADPPYLEVGLTERRVVVTCDADLLRLNATGLKHFGIIRWGGGTENFGLIVRWLVLAHEVYADDELVNKVEYLP